jgi:short-subunit dehydrogenase
VRGFSESLRHELTLANSPVKVSVVHPGGIKTNIVRTCAPGTGFTDNAAARNRSSALSNEFAKTRRRTRRKPSSPASRRTRPRILIGGDARLWICCSGFRPGTYLRVLQRRIESGSAQQAK